MNILKMMGLMRVSEHDAAMELKDMGFDALVRINKDRVKGLMELDDDRLKTIQMMNREIEALRADALAWREKKRKDADYEANRRVRKSKGESK